MKRCDGEDGVECPVKSAQPTLSSQLAPFFLPSSLQDKTRESRDDVILNFVQVNSKRVVKSPIKSLFKIFAFLPSCKNDFKNPSLLFGPTCSESHLHGTCLAVTDTLKAHQHTIKSLYLASY